MKPAPTREELINELIERGYDRSDVESLPTLYLMDLLDGEDE